MDTYEKIINWAWQSLIAEILFGVLLLGLVGWLIKYGFETFKVHKLLRKVLCVHNDPTRNWQKGLCIADRFIQIYESKVPLRSTMSDRVSTYAIWANIVLDKRILEFHGLVITVDKKSEEHVEAVRNRMTERIYTKLKRLEEREKKRTETFMHDESLRDMRDGIL